MKKKDLETEREAAIRKALENPAFVRKLEAASLKAEIARKKQDRLDDTHNRMSAHQLEVAIKYIHDRLSFQANLFEQFLQNMPRLIEALELNNKLNLRRVRAAELQLRRKGARFDEVQ